VFKYNTAATNTGKVEQSIANAGYDTPDYKASDDAYNNLDDCCKYDRTASAAATTTMKDEKCMKDGKCVKDMSCCKDDSKKDCCKKS
jgi:periplasmic mercuric ion binding protein